MNFVRNCSDLFFEYFAMKIDSLLLSLSLCIYIIYIYIERERESVNAQNMTCSPINKIFISNFFEFDMAGVQLHKMMQFLNH